MLQANARPIIHVYTSTRNESYMIPYFLRHYSLFADRIFVYDDDSGDGTRDILAANDKVRIMDPGFSGIDEILLQQLRSNEYRKHSRGVADWVMIVDCDEFHYPPDKMEYLGILRDQGIKGVIAEGYNMFSVEPPQGDGQIYDYVTKGVPDHMYHRMIFNPELDVVVGIGNHGYSVVPTDAKVVISNTFRLLHYKFLGASYLMNRHQKGYERLSERNHANGWGIHSSPQWNGNYSVRWYQEMLGKAKRCLD